MAGGLFRTHKAFLQTNAWQHQNLNALRYNTSQAGSVVPLGYGTFRQQVNLIDFGGYMGPGGGKKGKGVGPLPVGGTRSRGFKAGGGGKGKGGKGGGKKGSQNFSVDVDFGICQGPVTIGPQNFVFSSAGVAFFQSVGLNAYSGTDGQAADSVMAGLHPAPAIGYSGTCHITGTPMDLGMSPVIPNISFEVTGILAGTAGPNTPKDANPSKVVADFLSNARYGCSFPSANIDPAIDTTYGDYCLATGLVISPVLTGQTAAHEWLSGLAKLTNTAIVWSGDLLKFIPYGDQQVAGNGVVWTPNLVPEYSLTDDDFLPWHPSQLGKIAENQDDPILVTRSNPADAVNWLTIEYLDRGNFYNTTVIPVFDQAAIDAYELRTGDNLNGHCFCMAGPAQAAAQIHLQRLQYVRNLYRFQLGWKFALLEPMDIVLLTGRAGDIYLQQQPVRITSIDENENGDLTFEAEEISVGAAAPQPTPGGPLFLQWQMNSGYRSPMTPTTTAVADGAVILPYVFGGVIYNQIEVIVALIANRVLGGTPATVASVTDGFGLTWRHRTTVFGTTLPSGAEFGAEEWWADASGLPSGTTDIPITATFDTPVDVSLIVARGVGGGINTVLPFDPSSSVPATTSGSATAPTGSPVSTVSNNSIVLGWMLTAEDIPQLIGGMLPPAPWRPAGNVIAQDFLTGTHGLQVQMIYGAFAGPSAGATPTLSAINVTNEGYLFLTDALEGV